MVVAMSSINCQSYLENHELIFKLEEKLPGNSRRAWAQIKLVREQMKEMVNYLKTFAEWLKSEVNLLMSISTPSQVCRRNIPLDKKRNNIQCSEKRNGKLQAL
ncbi:hypothetical protein JTB14_014345 [Gonioctena quinquepunctata]|nr:hypothetical protein JTB14_014345 [Gonioctena quinquepunctata]